jgi:hypothetical protein
MVHIPWVILENMNISTPTTTADFLPTIMSIFKVESDNPTWVMDGIDLSKCLSPIDQIHRSDSACSVSLHQILDYWFCF